MREQKPVRDVPAHSRPPLLRRRRGLKRHKLVQTTEALRILVDARFGIFAGLSVLSLVGMLSGQADFVSVLCLYGLDACVGLLTFLVLMMIRDRFEGWLAIIGGCVPLLLLAGLTGWFAITSRNSPDTAASNAVDRELSPVGLVFVAYLIGSYVWLAWRELRGGIGRMQNLGVRLVAPSVLPWFISMFVLFVSGFLGAVIHEFLRPMVYLLVRGELQNHRSRHDDDSTEPTDPDV